MSDEHIVPYGLGADAVLKNASCETCAKVTGRIEGHILRGPIWHVRKRLGLKSRRPQEAPTTCRFTVFRGTEQEEIDLPIDESPLMLGMLIFPPPSFVTGQGPETGIAVIGCNWYNFGPSVEEATKRLGATDLQGTQTHKPAEFARMIAKIGYCFAVANYGVDAFEEVFVTPAILGQSENVGRWVGTVDRFPGVYSTMRHRLLLKTDPVTRALFAEIHLLSQFESPVYGVVIGKLRPERIGPL